ncbi:tyrosine-type recombinase/integrase [Rhodococcus pyridinivorans]|uniref:tyrosine-type recombinase/integrase n=1 Tax=Rhodococcus pyridinivorans TaxID=103816 RepID=UPI003AAD0DBC
MGAGKVLKTCGCVGADGRRLNQRCPKLRRPNGSYAPGHGSYGYRWAFTDATGKRRHLSKSGFSTRDDAQAALDKVRRSHAQGIDVANRQTLGEYLDEWLASKYDLKESSRSQYRGYIDRVLRPHIGKIPLSDLRPQHVTRGLEDYLRTPGRARTKNNGLTTTQRARAVLRSALTDAVKDGLVERNAAGLARVRSSPRAKARVWTHALEEEWRAEVQKLVDAGMTLRDARKHAPRPSGVMVLRPDHLAVLLDHVADTRDYALWLMLCTRGLRRGEVAGLRWSSIDLEHGSATIERARVSVRGVVREETPKTQNSVRTIALGDDLTAALRAHRATQAREELAGGFRTPYVFTTPAGQPRDPNKLSHAFKRLLFDLDLPVCHLHTLRHAAASLAIKANVPMKVLQAQLGHANLSTTADIYSSVYADIHHDAANATSDVLRQARRKDASDRA